MNKITLWNEHNLIKLKELVTNKLSVTEIAKIFNTSKQGIYLTCSRNNIILDCERYKTKSYFIEFDKKVNNPNLSKIIKRRYANKKCICRTKNTNFDLTLDFLYELYLKQNGLCFYSKIPMELKEGKDKKNIYVLSIDKINPNKSYTKDNIVLCCEIVNRMKSDLDTEKFLEIVNKINDKKVGL